MDIVPQVADRAPSTLRSLSLTPGRRRLLRSTRGGTPYPPPPPPDPGRGRSSVGRFIKLGGGDGGGNATPGGREFGGSKGKRERRWRRELGLRTHQFRPRRRRQRRRRYKRWERGRSANIRPYPQLTSESTTSPRYTARHSVAATATPLTTPYRAGWKR